MPRTIAAGTAYFALVMSVGFALGAVRTLLIAPRIGEAAAVLVETPVILTAAWLICGWLLVRFAVPPAWTHRLVMGGLAFALLMCAEIALSLSVFDRSFAAYLAHLATPAGALGLLGQIAFAAFPLVRRRTGAGPAL